MNSGINQVKNFDGDHADDALAAQSNGPVGIVNEDKTGGIDFAKRTLDFEEELQVTAAEAVKSFLAKVRSRTNTLPESDNYSAKTISPASEKHSAALVSNQAEVTEVVQTINEITENKISDLDNIDALHPGQVLIDATAQDPVLAPTAKIRDLKSRSNNFQLSAFQKFYANRKSISLAAVSIGILTAVFSSNYYFTRVSARESEMASDLVAHGRYKESIELLSRMLLLTKNADFYILRGRAYALSGNLALSFKDYLSALKLQPNNVQVLRNLANLSLGKKDYKSAAEYFERCQKLSIDDGKRSLEFQKKFALSLLSGNEFDKATEVYQDIAAKHRDPSALIDYARSLFYGEKYDQSIVTLNKILKEDPNSVDALILRAKCYEHTFNGSEARTDLNRVVSIQPESCEALCARGSLNARFRDFEAARADFKKALALDPNFQTAYIQIADSYLLEGRLEECAAKLAFVSTMNGFAVNSNYQFVQARLCKKRGDYKRSLALLKSALSNDPVNATRYRLEMAESYLKLADYKKALLSCDDILRLQPNNSSAILISAEINQACGDYTDAKRDFDRAAELAPKDPEVFEKRGTFFLLTRQFGSAEQDLRKALNISPSFPGVKLKLASCIKQVSLVHGRDFEIDRTKLSNVEVKEIGAADAAQLKRLGYVALEKSKITYAVAALTRAVMLMPNDPMARHYLAYALLAAHEYDAAITQFYAWGKLEAISDDDEIAFATSIANDGETDKAKLFIGRLATQFSKRSASLIKLANLCLKQKFNILGMEVVSAGLKIASSEEKVAFDRLSTEFDHVNDAPKTNQDISPIGKS